MSHLLLKSSLHQIVKQSLIRHCRNATGQVVTKGNPLEEQNEQSNKDTNTLEKSEKMSKMSAKQTVKKPTRPPFMKNIFLGKFDTEILTYPEALDKNQVERLEQDIQSVQFYIDNTENSTRKESWESAKQLKLFGLQAPQLENGRELNLTESLRFSEILAQRSDDVQLLSNEQAIKALLHFGNENQLAKYLPDVTSGKITMAWCVAEEGECDPKQFITTATFDAAKKQWVLNGRKLHVINGNTADLFVVLAKSKVFVAGMNESDVSAFLVERTFGGVTSKPGDALGLKGSDISEVVFENTHVPQDNLLGKENRGMQYYSKALPEIHLMNAVSSCAVARKAYNMYFDYCKDISKDGNNLLETELVEEKQTDFASRIYAMESMIYLTAGLLDIYENQDCQMEGSITKVFSAQHSADITSHIIQLIGPAAYYSEHWANVCHRDALNYLLFNGAPDSSKIIIALQGLQFAGIQLQHLIKKIRNPLFHTKEVFTRMWTQRRNNSDNPRLVLQLSNYLHPSAISGAEWLEYSVLRVQYAAELMLAHYGVEVVNKHTDLVRLAECAMDIYAMTASLGRASRSYCIGLSHSDYEVLLAIAFCQKAMRRVKDSIRLIQDGPYVNNDVAHKKLAAKVNLVRGYFPVHPLARNF